MRNFLDVPAKMSNKLLQRLRMLQRVRNESSEFNII
jgi:hypothetical protein